jgi:hypothetical protein
MTRAEACGTAGRAVAAPDAPGPRRIPKDLSRLLLQESPLPGFIAGERLVAEVQLVQWVAGMGDERRWIEAFQQSQYERGLQHFWSDPSGANMMTHQVLLFADENGAQDFHRFYNRELCGSADQVSRVPRVPGAVHFLRQDPKGWSNEATFVRGRLFVYVGLLSQARILNDPRVANLAREAAALARP